MIESRAMKWDLSLGTKKCIQNFHWLVNVRSFGNLGVNVMIILKEASFVYVDRTGSEYC